MTIIPFRVKRLRTFAGLVGAVGLTLIATACASPSSNYGNLGGGDTVVTDDAATEPTREPIAPREVSPFDEFRNLLWGMGMDEESQQRQFEADRVREENMIAQCMNELGFEYIPFVDSVVLSFGNDEDWNPDDPDWVARYGYGWVVSPPGGRGGARISVDMNNVGPNAQMLSELSETERSAWNNALWNMGAGFEREVEGVIQRDCFNWARMSVSAESRTIANLAEFAPLMEAIAQMHDSLRWDISDADRAWSTCMADAGFPGFDRQREASETIAEEYGPARIAATLDPSWDQTFNNPTVENSPVMAALHEREVALATADLNCRITTDFEAGREAHIHTVENQFIIDHRADLEALRAAAEQRD